jgi:hypothetical protein
MKSLEIAENTVSMLWDSYVDVFGDIDGCGMNSSCKSGKSKTEFYILTVQQPNPRREISFEILKAVVWFGVTYTEDCRIEALKLLHDSGEYP